MIAISNSHRISQITRSGDMNGLSKLGKILATCLVTPKGCCNLLSLISKDVVVGKAEARGWVNFARG